MSLLGILLNGCLYVTQITQNIKHFLGKKKIKKKKSLILIVILCQNKCLIFTATLTYYLKKLKNKKIKKWLYNRSQ